jgi:flagellar biosynthesis protein FlhG
LTVHSAPTPAPSQPGEPALIAIASGKGGVGKTWFAITLAHALARLGRRVLLFDADLGLANIDIQLGFTPARDLGAVFSGELSLGEVAQAYREGGFDIVAGRSGSGSLAGLSTGQVAGVIAGLRGLNYDDIILDLGAGLERANRRMAAEATLLLVLATDEPSSLTDAYAVLKLHGTEAPNTAAAIVINQASGDAAGQRTYATLARACAHFLKKTPKLAGVIRRDERVRDAIRRQTLLMTRHPFCPAAADVERIAADWADGRKLLLPMSA